MFPQALAHISIQQLNIFLLCARYENFSRAAEELFLTQSTVSRNIAYMEEEMGLVLFIRHKQRVRLTPAGAKLAKEFEHLTIPFQNAVDAARAAQEVRERTLYIGDIDTMPAEAYLMPVLTEFEVQYPDIEVKVSRSNPQNILDGLYQGRFDAAFFVAIGQERFRHSDFTYMPVTSATPAVVIGRGNLAFTKTIPTIHDLQGCIFLGLQNKYQDAYWKQISKYFTEIGFNVPRIRYVDNPHSMVLELERGNYVAVMDRMFASGYDSLRVIDLPGCPKLNGIGIVYPVHTDKASVQNLVQCTQEITYDPLYTL